MKTSERSFKKIIWALDPFESETDSNEHIIEFFRDIHERQNELEVFPVSLLWAGQWPTLFGDSQRDPSFWPRMISSAEERLADLFSSLPKTDFLRPAKIIAQTAGDLNEAVDILLEEAHESDAQSFFVHGHTHGSVERFFNGSFTETLLRRSSLPVFAWGGPVRDSRPLNRILFPTDFGERSKKSFRTVVDFAQAMGAEVVLFHAFSAPVLSEGSFESPLMDFQAPPVRYETLREKQWEHQSRRAYAWAEWAEALGVPTEVVIEDGGGEIDRLIVELTKKIQIDMVAMEGPSERVPAYILSNIAIETFRRAEVPLLLLPMHPFEELDLRHEDENLELKADIDL